MLEILLVVAIISLIGGITVPVLRSFQTRNDLNTAIGIISQSLRRAQVKSQGQDQDSAWGLYMESGKVVVYKGDSYESRDQAFDEDFDISTTITFSGMDDVNYEKFTGDVISPGTITLTTIDDISRTITVNDKGTIDY